MKYSILIIDDSNEDRYLLKRYLNKCGLDVNIAEASNGEEALDRSDYCGYVLHI
jgi:CheY-like chemotaxis protein